MAIFQPTNIIPSSFTQGTVDVNDTMEISWQVNGNSALAAFQIDFYLNDYASTFVYSTGKLPKTGETQAQYNLPFYGTDRFGRPQFFTYNAGESWAQASMLEANPFTNGNNYKFKITQWYIADKDEYSVTFTDSLYATYCYFRISPTQLIGFILPTGNYPNGGQFFYNTRTQIGYGILNGNYVSLDMKPPTVDEPAGKDLGTASNEIELKPTSFASFITRKTPTLTVYQTNETYLNPTELSDTLATSIGYFHAEYQQDQGDPIRWIRWQVATATKNTDNTYNLGDILADTGDIYTPTLNYEFNGFFNGRSYAIRCTGESESGQVINLQNTNSDGWIFFNISFKANTYDGNFTVQCLHKENATFLEWEGVTAIPPTISPESYDPTISNNSVTLLPKNNNTEYAVTWDKQVIINPETNQSETIPINFPNDWTAVWKGKIKLNVNSSTTSVSGTPNQQTIIDGKTYWFYESSFFVEHDINKILQIDVNTYPEGTTYDVELEQTMGGNYVKYKLITQTPRITLSADFTLYEGEPESPTGQLFSIFSNENAIISLIQNSESNSNHFTVNAGGIEKTISIQGLAETVAIIFSPNSATAYFYDKTKIVYQTSISLSYTQQPISAISIYGGDNGATVESVAVYQGDGSNIISLYQQLGFEPVWNSNEYELYMAANFNGNLEGGTGTASGAGFRIYRQEIGKSRLTPIATVPSTITSLKDYGISSRKAYKYSLHAYDINGAFMSAVEADNIIATCFKNYSLLVCDYDETNDEYHVRKQYLFALNLNAGSVGNNNSPTLNKNFTRFPARMPDTANYKRGTLSGLIGAIYTVPALIEQIGQYKYTAKPSTLDYFDSVDLEKELYDLSTAPYQLFLRDMKGRLRMVHTNGAISMTTNIKQKQQSISISFPWVEIGDARDVTIIQTPDDYGWNNDNQVLDVQLDVDVATGELSATYPFPYNGTKFYLTGVNKETLTAKTPLDITPAQFNLSEVAEEPNDGEVTATVKVNGGGD